MWHVLQSKGKCWLKYCFFTRSLYWVTVFDVLGVRVGVECIAE